MKNNLIKKYFFVAVVGILSGNFISCNNEDAQQSDTQDSVAAVQDIWKFEYDSARNEMHIITQRSFGKDTLQPATVINFLNNNYPEVPLEFVKTSYDTIFTKISESEFLSQHMGSAGADFYLKAATYLLTDLKDVNYVSFQFPEGDHAVPGVYKRQDWEDLR